MVDENWGPFLYRRDRKCVLINTLFGLDIPFHGDTKCAWSTGLPCLIKMRLWKTVLASVLMRKSFHKGVWCVPPQK